MTLEAFSDPTVRRTARWADLIYRGIVGAAPLEFVDSAPLPERPAAHRRRFALTSPAGHVAVATLLTTEDCNAAAVESYLQSAGASVLVTDVSGVGLPPAPNNTRVTASGPGALARVDTNTDWLRSVGPAPPSVQSELLVYIPVPGEGDGLLVLPAKRVACVVIRGADHHSATLEVCERSLTMRFHPQPHPAAQRYAAFQTRVLRYEAGCSVLESDARGSIQSLASESVEAPDATAALAVSWTTHAGAFGLLVAAQDDDSTLRLQRSANQL